MDDQTNVIPFERPRCAWCGAFKPEDQLNGYNPLAPIGKRYENAYCRTLTECKSNRASQTIIELLESQLD